MKNSRPKAQIRSLTPAAAASFVAQGAGGLVNQASSALMNGSTSAASGNRRGVVSRKRKGDLDRVTAYLPCELGADLRMRCAGKRIELSEAIAAAVRTWLGREGQQ